MERRTIGIFEGETEFHDNKLSIDLVLSIGDIFAADKQFSSVYKNKHYGEIEYAKGNVNNNIVSKFVRIVMIYCSNVEIKSSYRLVLNALHVHLEIVSMNYCTGSLHKRVRLKGILT